LRGKIQPFKMLPNMKSTFSAAVAAADITPPVGPVLQGHYSTNPSHAVLRPLQMRSLIFRNAHTSVCIVSIDAISVTTQTSDRLRQLISKSAGVPEHNILIAASHTHCGPATRDVLSMPQDPAFMKLIEQHAADTAARAAKSLRPVTVGLGCGSASFNVNRRPLPGSDKMAPNYAGIVDRRARFLRMDNEASQPLCLLFHYSCHPTSKKGSEGIISPDYPGFARAEIEKELGCHAMFLPGCFGNVRPNLLTDTGTFASATEQQLVELGHELSKSVCNAAKAICTVSADRLEVAEMPFVLPFAPTPSHAELDAIIVDPNTTALRLGWAKRLQERIRSKTVPAEVRSSMQAVRVGPLQLVTIPGEPVQEIGHAIEKLLAARSDAQEIWPVGYTNGMLGYLCTERQKNEGGYEPNAYPYYDYPAPFDHEEQRIVETAAKLVK
jgi:hypothetical protein